MSRPMIRPTIRTLALAIAMAVISTAPLAAGDMPIAGELGHIPPNLDAIRAEAARVQAAGCASSACAAVNEVALVLRVMLDEQATTMGITRPLPRDRERLTERRFGSTIIGQPSRYGAACLLARDLVAGYPGAAHNGDLFVAVGMIELAVRIDLHGGQCLGAVLASFPPSRQADVAIRNARVLCVNAWKLGSLCRRIARL